MNWEFFIEDKAGNETLICERKCIRPYRLNLWKLMELWLRYGKTGEGLEVFRIGYRIKQ